MEFMGRLLCIAFKYSNAAVVSGEGFARLHGNVVAKPIQNAREMSAKSRVPKRKVRPGIDLIIILNAAGLGASTPEVRIALCDTGCKSLLT
jgi:hypothetical protein